MLYVLLLAVPWLFCYGVVFYLLRKDDKEGGYKRLDAARVWLNVGHALGVAYWTCWLAAAAVATS